MFNWYRRPAVQLFLLSVMSLLFTLSILRSYLQLGDVVRVYYGWVQWCVAVSLLIRGLRRRGFTLSDSPVVFASCLLLLLTFSVAAQWQSCPHSQCLSAWGIPLYFSGTPCGNEQYPHSLLRLIYDAFSQR